MCRLDFQRPLVQFPTLRPCYILLDLLHMAKILIVFSSLSPPIIKASRWWRQRLDTSVKGTTSAECWNSELQVESRAGVAWEAIWFENTNSAKPKSEWRLDGITQKLNENSEETGREMCPWYDLASLLKTLSCNVPMHLRGKILKSITWSTVCLRCQLQYCVA